MKPSVFRLLGALGLLGVVSMVATDVLGILAQPHYDALADTISVLAYHRLTGPQDLGLYVLAVGCFALGLGMLFWIRGGLGRVLLFALLELAGLSIVALTVSDVRIPAHPSALTVHVDASLAVGAALLAGCLLFPFFLPRRRRVYRHLSLGLGGLLIALACAYGLIPPGRFGLYERVLVADGLAWVALLSFALLRSPWRGGAEALPKEKGPPANREP